jgi:hypothetical protein
MSYLFMKYRCSGARIQTRKHALKVKTNSRPYSRGELLTKQHKEVRARWQQLQKKKLSPAGVFWLLLLLLLLLVPRRAAETRYLARARCCTLALALIIININVLNPAPTYTATSIWKRAVAFYGRE